jgi:hypothetical protein
MELPRFELAIEFYETYLGLRHETGQKYLARGILTADAETGNGRPLFKVDLESIERHKEEIRAYKRRQALARENIRPKELVV